ncbi:inhibin beta E chain-like [Hydractinia symbiolongicarpus]|uniref:inhibin beta E chain-like n=1 Tax=Hydractinia symbiolongicarpus TaxID=13093 RepID=UPI002549D448|nr:inhibin beta E chain-like [Hydractinia symbiolongicarpus]
MSLKSRALLFLIFQKVCMRYFGESLPTTCDGKCGQKFINDTLIHQQRIEMIKQEILDKLGLQAPPEKRGSLNDIPKALLDGFRRSVEKSRRLKIMKERENVKKMIILAENVNVSEISTAHEKIIHLHDINVVEILYVLSLKKLYDCITELDKLFPQVSSGEKRQVIKLKYASQSHFSVVENMRLWLYIKPINTSRISVISVVQSSKEKEQIQRIMLRKKLNYFKTGWFEIKINDIKTWTRKTYSGHLLVDLKLRIHCKNCKLEMSGENQPFLELTEKSRVLRRNRRNIMCRKDSKVCCLQRFYVSFKDIGWDDWIISPPGYNAQQCRGSCDSLGVGSTDHASIIKAVADKRKIDAKLCCTAQQYDSLSILYKDSEGNLVKQGIKDMIATHCGCG